MNTLVLDISYQPVGRVSWERAVTLLFEQKVEIVEEYVDWFVHSASMEFKVPSIIRWLRGSFKRRKSVRFTRENLLIRDGYSCQYCGCRVERADATYDHVIPKSQKGPTRWENIVICCEPCNQKKGSRTPEQARMKLRNKPVKPKTLPTSWRYIMEWKPDMPESWRAWLKDTAASLTYWHGELHQD